MTDYQQPRCPHGWVDVTQCESCAQAAEIDALRTLITKLHAAKGRYHTQLACCDLFDAVGLKNERPVK